MKGIMSKDIKQQINKTDIGISAIKGRKYDRANEKAKEIWKQLSDELLNGKLLLHELEIIAEQVNNLANNYKKQVFKKGDRVLVDMSDQDLPKDFYWGKIEKYGQKRISVELEIHEDIDDWNKDWIVPIINIYNPKWGDK
jgi:hypothetical protein